MKLWHTDFGARVICKMNINVLKYRLMFIFIALNHFYFITFLMNSCSSSVSLIGYIKVCAKGHFDVHNSICAAQFYNNHISHFAVFSICSTKELNPYYSYYYIWKILSKKNMLVGVIEQQIYRVVWGDHVLARGDHYRLDGVVNNTVDCIVAIIFR